MVVKKKKALKHGRSRYGKSEFFPYLKNDCYHFACALHDCTIIY